MKNQLIIPGQFEIDDYDCRQIENRSALISLLRHSAEIASVSKAALHMVSHNAVRSVVGVAWSANDSPERDMLLCRRVAASGAIVELSNYDDMETVLSPNDGVGDTSFQYYVGIPLCSPAGHCIAVLSLAHNVSKVKPLSQKIRSRLAELSIIAADVLESHRADYHRQRVNEMMQAQATALEMAVLGKDLPVVADALITGVESIVKGCRATLMIVDQDQMNLRWLAGPSMATTYRDNNSVMAIEEEAAPPGITAWCKEAVFCDDISTHAKWTNLPAQLATADIVGFWSTPLFSLDGKLIGVLTVYFDKLEYAHGAKITLLKMAAVTSSIIIERDKTFMALMESESHLKTAKEIAQLGILNTVPGTGHHMSCRVTNCILGLPLDQMGLTMEQYNRIVHPDDLVRLLRDYADATVTGTFLKTQYRIIRQSDGAIRWIEGHGVPVRDFEKRLIRFAGVIQDITEKKLIEQALHLNQRAVESSSNGVVIVDALADDMPVLYVNPALLALTGYEREEILGKNCRFLQNNDTDQLGIRDIRAALRHERECHTTLRNFSKSGKEYWVDLRLSPIKDENGSVTHYVGFQVDVTQRVLQQNALKYQANHDALTGLVNRTLLKDRIDQLVRGQRKSDEFAIVFIDLDRFKLVNDSLGHQMGDCLLKETAQRLLQQVRSEDTVARMGGDEFVVILHDVDCDAAQNIIQSILAVLKLPYYLDHHTLSISASAGVAIFPIDGQDTSTLLRNADIAMYHAKTLGRSNYQIFSSSLSQAAGEKLELREALLKALANSEFCLHYQPKVDALTGALVGFEALVRWNHPVRGLLYPGTFIGAAEEFGIIADLGNWVIEEACWQMRAWRNEQRFNVPVAVNVSIMQFRNSAFITGVEHALEAAGLEPSMLELEVTESMMMESPERFVEILTQFNKLGIAISIDDFGTGYSNLSFLRKFPINYLKIDRSFVSDITADPSAAVLCITILSMAHNLGLQVVAEGVETIEQAEFLRLHNCDVLQGFLISKPLPPSAQFCAFPMAVYGELLNPCQASA